MKRLAFCSLCALVLAGCSLFKVHTDSEIGVKRPVETLVRAEMIHPVETHVLNETVLLHDPGPLEEMPVGEGPAAAECKPPGCKVAVIDVDGLLLNVTPTGPGSSGENPLAVFSEKLNRAACDPAVKAVVLRINSTGGGVAATDLMWQNLQEFRTRTKKPVVACLLDYGAGGAYYLASGCDRVLAAPTSVVGGIGVVLNLYYLEQAMEKQNIFDATLRSGKLADMGTPARALTAEEKKLFQAMLDEFHARFKQIVRQGRPAVPADAVFFDGRVMTADQAIQGGLVDALGYLPNAITTAGQLAGCEAPLAVLYRRKGDAARSLYATSASKPFNVELIPYSVPGLDRSRLPQFLYMWDPEPTLPRRVGQ